MMSRALCRVATRRIAPRARMLSSKPDSSFIETRSSLLSDEIKAMQTREEVLSSAHIHGGVEAPAPAPGLSLAEKLRADITDLEEKAARRSKVVATEDETAEDCGPMPCPPSDYYVTTPL